MMRVNVVAGTWEGSDNPYGAQVTWTVTETGSLEGMDTTGCVYAGEVANIHPDYNLYDVQVAINGCAIAGDYQGLLYRTTGGNFGDPYLIVSLDDGQETALNLALADLSAWR